LESLQAVVEAAEELQTPTIAGFNGDFLMHPGRTKPPDLAYYAGLGLAVRRASVPIAFLLNESTHPEQIELGLALGFNAVMVENGRMELGAYHRLVQEVVVLAHAHGAAVEAQIGHLPDRSNGLEAWGELTDPELARYFVETTGVDALAVAIGNVHMLTQGKAPVDLAALQEIRKVVKIPLVLHGGTSFPSECAAAAIDLGVAKFNFGTCLKQAYLARLQEKLAAYREPMNPHPFLGMGGDQDILQAGCEAVKSKVKQLIQCYGWARRPARPNACLSV
jgi:fructose-bisphosphate aldolase class II